MPTYGEFVALVFFGTIGVTLTAWGTVKILNEVYWNLYKKQVDKNDGFNRELFGNPCDDEVDYNPFNEEGCMCDECVAEREGVGEKQVSLKGNPLIYDGRAWTAEELKALEESPFDEEVSE